MPKRFVLGVALAIVAFSLSGLSKLPEYQDLIPEFGELPVAEVTRIVDGDTVELRFDGAETGERCRFAGVNTPEINKANVPDEWGGKEANTFVKNLLKGEKVWVENHGKGIHERPLVCLFRVPDGLYVNLEVIRQGYGEVYLRGEFDKKQVFLDYQEFAQQAKKGIWAEKDGVEGSEFVYITSSGKGKRYHKTAERRYIRDRDVRISLEEAKRRELEPCKRCKSE